MSSPKVSVVILNFNGKEHLRTCLDSVLKTDYSNFEIVFVDNGSIDGSVDFVRQHFPQVKVVRNSKNLGAAAGYNTGILNSRGKYVAILNNDTEVDKDWLAECVRVAESKLDVGVCDSKYLNFYDRSRFDTVSAGGRFLDIYGNVFTRGCNGADKGQFDTVTDVFAGLTLYKKCALEEAGIFDASFVYGYDEMDLCWRIRLRGYRIVYVPKSRIYHKVSRSVKHQNRLKPDIYFYIKRNRLRMLIQNHSIEKLVVVLPIVLFEYAGYLTHWATRKDLEYFMETLKALLWIPWNFKEVWKKRKIARDAEKKGNVDFDKVFVHYCGDLLRLAKGTF
jgi:GT2 family glycosyltransferase